ncbi:MAG: CvpA family protein [Tissierellia bacterium]|nr:CvpA family protein [Tissierellia bacterium]
MNFVDILIIIFIGVSCFDGYKKGFIKTLFDTIGLIVAFLLSRNLYGFVEQFLLNHTRLYVKVYGFFENKAASLSGLFESNKQNITNDLVGSLKLPAELQNVVSNIFIHNTSTNTNLFATFVDKISIILIRSISFIITFLVLYIMLVLLSNFINLIFKLPGLNITNRVFGAAVGILKSIIILYIAFALCTPLIGFNSNGFIAENILNSESSKIFYDNNLILNYLSYKGFYEN